MGGLRNCASESSLLLLERRESLQADYRKKVREQQRSSLHRTSFTLEDRAKRAEKSSERVSSRLLTALALAVLAWFLGLHFSSFKGATDETDFERAMRTLDNICPPLTRKDNTSVALTEFDFEHFQGDWHKVAWLREPDKDDMRCRFVTDSEEARNLQHLEQISPAKSYKSKGYHFLLNRVSKLWVVDTDYASWAMLYTCSPHFGTTTQQAFIVSRKKTLDIVTMGDVLNKWSEYNIPWKEFKIKEQQHQCA